MPPPTLPQLDTAGVPLDLRPFITDSTLEFYHLERNGTLVFNIPKKEETRTEVWLHWHPEDPATWDYEDTRWFVRIEHYHDRRHDSVAGSEQLDIGPDVSDLVDWLEAED